MNILFLLHSYPKIGGIEMVTQTISQYLKLNHNLYYLARVADDTLQADKTGCYYFPSKKLDIATQYYNDLIEQLKIDVVINQGPFLPFTPIISNNKRNKAVKVYSFVHFAPGFEFERIKYVWQTEKHPVKRWIKRLKTKFRLNTLQYNPEKTRKQYRRLYDVCENIVVLSPAYIKLFMDSYKLTEGSKLIYISNPARYKCEDADILNKKRRVVLFVGRLEFESKRVDRLLSIWKSIENCSDWCLKIVGDGPHRTELERIVSDEKIDGVVFAGQQDDLRPFYAEASIVALTSTYEGLSLCFIEGVEYGCVPIAYDVSYGNRDLIESISNEILVEPFNQNRYIEVLQKLMQNVDYRGELAKSALLKRDEFSLQSVGQEWDRLLK